MNAAFKFRFVNEITGAFVLLAVVAMAAGILPAVHKACLSLNFISTHSLQPMKALSD